MRRTQILRAGTALTLSLLSTSAFAGNAREDLVMKWLNGTSLGLDVKVGSTSYDPTTQAVVLENVELGNIEKDLFSFKVKNIAFEDPHLEGPNTFAAHAIRSSGYHIEVHFDVAKWFPEFTELIQKTEGGATGGSDATATDGGDAAATDGNSGETSNAPADKSASNKKHGSSRDSHKNKQTPPVGGDIASPDKAEGDGSTATDTPAETATNTPPPVVDYAVDVETLTYERPVFPMTGPDFKSGDSLFSKYFAIARWTTTFRADWIEADNVSVTTKGAGEGDFTANYEMYYVSGMHDGRAERAGFTNYEQKPVEAGGPFKSFKIGGAYVIGIDTNAMLEAIDPAAYKDGKGDGQRRVVYGQYGINDLSVDFDGGTMSLGNFEADSVYMRQTEKPLVSSLEKIFKDPKSLENDPFTVITDVLPSYTQLMGVDFIKTSDFKVEAGEDFTFGIGSMNLNNVDANGIGALTFRTMDAESKTASAKGSLSLLTFQNIKFGSLMSLINLGKSSAENGGEPTPAAIRDAVLEGGTRIDFIEAGALSVDLPDNLSFGWDAAAITLGNYFKALPQREDITITNVHFPTSVITDPDVKQQLTDMGYETISLSGGMTLTWNTETGDVALEDMTLRAKDMGMVSADVHLGNLPLSMLDKPDELEARVQEGTFVSGSITYGNFGIVEKGFEQQAKKLNQDPAKFRKSTADAIPLMLTFLDDKDIQKAFEGPIKVFLNDPKSITLSVQPDKPISFAKLQTVDTTTPTALFKLLNVDVKANE
ncbi:hypothetical protein [Oryzibacter oryziterrae]|uniref:hypothetical protein n=1 Tax=Oryzibacter oryziterrae TaxID=2766474 RepID=UPI001F1DF508|nr:hypothetical protein [Oryzibacter oryziterrae]